MEGVYSPSLTSARSWAVAARLLAKELTDNRYGDQPSCPSDTGMGLFSRAPRSPFPADMLRWLDRFGRFSFDPMGSGVETDEIMDRLGSLYEYATSDPDGFIGELSALVQRDRGGFATYGAASLMWEMYSGEALRMPAALPLIDAGIEFKLSRGLGAMLTGFQMERFHQLLLERKGSPPQQPGAEQSTIES